MTSLMSLLVCCLVATTMLVVTANPSDETELKPGDWRDALRNPFLKPQIVGDTCKSLAELESTDFFRLAYSANGTVLELGRAQKFLVIRCLAQDDSCGAINFDSSTYDSRCETKMGVRRALGRRHESDDEYTMWDILLPAACGCSMHQKGEKAATTQTV